MAGDLTPFSYLVLALVGRDGAGPHDIARMMREGRTAWTAARSQYFAEPKRLERLGYLESAKRPGQTTARTHYTLTRAGTQALVAWLGEPAAFSRIQSEPVVKLLAADFVDEEVTLGSLRALREEIEEVRAELDVIEARAAALPHRERYLRINHVFMRAILRAHEELVEAAEEELAP
jgi:DNA-binding PadR family transcriptional regulator